MKEDEPQTEYLSVNEVCNLLKVSERTLERWRQIGMPHFQVTKRGRVLFRKDQILSWIDNHTYNLRYDGRLVSFKQKIEEIKRMKS